jgi:hypothetical protein
MKCNKVSCLCSCKSRTVHYSVAAELFAKGTSNACTLLLLGIIHATVLPDQGSVDPVYKLSVRVCGYQCTCMKFYNFRACFMFIPPHSTQCIHMHINLHTVTPIFRDLLYQQYISCTCILECTHFHSLFSGSPFAFSVCVSTCSINALSSSYYVITWKPLNFTKLQLVYHKDVHV